MTIKTKTKEEIPMKLAEIIKKAARGEDIMKK